jgi:hypothetical protein
VSIHAATAQSHYTTTTTIIASKFFTTTTSKEADFWFSVDMPCNASEPAHALGSGQRYRTGVNLDNSSDY